MKTFPSLCFIHRFKTCSLHHFSSLNLLKFEIKSDVGNNYISKNAFQISAVQSKKMEVHTRWLLRPAHAHSTKPLAYEWTQLVRARGCLAFHHVHLSSVAALSHTWNVDLNEVIQVFFLSILAGWFNPALSAYTNLHLTADEEDIAKNVL